jgi:hypothetical protein
MIGKSAGRFIFCEVNRMWGKASREAVDTRELEDILCAEGRCTWVTQILWWVETGGLGLCYPKCPNARHLGRPARYPRPWAGY